MFLRLLIIVLFLHPFWVQAEGAEPAAFIMATIPEGETPKELNAYVGDNAAGVFREVKGVFLEHGEPTGSELVWGAFLPADEPEPSALVLLVKRSSGSEVLYEIERGSFSFFSSQTADEIRARIALLREQIGESNAERDELIENLKRLQRDARIIGGFEKLEELERERKYQEGELKRIQSQVAQLKRSIQELKNWQEPSDLAERKRVLIRDVQELQSQRKE